MYIVDLCNRIAIFVDNIIYFIYKMKSSFNIKQILNFPPLPLCPCQSKHIHKTTDIMRSNKQNFSSSVLRRSSTSQPPHHDLIDSESPPQHLLADPLSMLGMSLETNRCKPNQSFVWCLPFDYNQEKHPFTCKLLFSC